MRCALVLLLAACAAPPRSTQATPPPVDAAVPIPCAGNEFGLAPGLAPVVAARYAKKRGTAGTATKQMVATSNHFATEAGLAVLRRGGNAADAFVAAVLVNDVVFPGVTSTAGLAGILVYEAKTKKLTYVHGGLADPIDPARRWHPGDSEPGKRVLVPGAPAAYVELVHRFGKRRLATLVEPAARLATDGFQLDALYARSIVGRRSTLERSEYGRRVFFHDGTPVAEGETLKLEALGATLRSYGKDSRWFYTGAWAREAIALANGNGGALTAADFATYRPEVAEPIHDRVHGHDVYAAGHGGVKVLVSLEAIERLRGTEAAESQAMSATALERLLLVRRATTWQPMLHDRGLVARGAAAEADVHRAAQEVEAQVRAVAAALPTGASGTHSSAVIVVDAEGNIVVGTHTIETMNWGEGLFAGGVPLATPDADSFDDAVKATVRMRVDPLSATIVLKDGAPIAALTVYGTGLHPADVQILDAVIARGLDAEAAVLEPRVGYFAYDTTTDKLDFTKNSVDPRFGRELLCTLSKRGFTLERSSPGYPIGVVDTGFPTLVTLAPGRLNGMTPDAYYIHGVAAGD